MTITCSKSLPVWLSGHIPESLSCTEIIFLSIFFSNFHLWASLDRSGGGGIELMVLPCLPDHPLGPAKYFGHFFSFFKIKISIKFGFRFPAFWGKQFYLFVLKHKYGPQMNTFLRNTQVPSIFQMRNLWNSFFCVWLILQIDGGERDVDIIMASK